MDVYCIVDIVSLVDQLPQSPSIAYAVSLCSRAAAAHQHCIMTITTCERVTVIKSYFALELICCTTALYQLQLCISDCLHSCSVCSVRVSFSCSPPTITTLTTTTRLRLNRRLTPMRLHCDHSTTYVTTVGLPVWELLHRSLNKQAVRVVTQYAPAPPAVRTLRPTSSP